MPKELVESQRASVLAMIEAGYTRPQIVSACGVSLRTVSKYRGKLRDNGIVGLVKPSVLAIIKKDIQSRTLLKTSHTLSLLENAKLPQITSYRELKDASVAFGIQHQHHRLASGQSTENQQGFHVVARVIEGIESKIRNIKARNIKVKVKDV